MHFYKTSTSPFLKGTSIAIHNYSWIMYSQTVWLGTHHTFTNPPIHSPLLHQTLTPCTSTKLQPRTPRDTANITPPYTPPSYTKLSPHAHLLNFNHALPETQPILHLHTHPHPPLPTLTSWNHTKHIPHTLPPGELRMLVTLTLCKEPRSIPAQHIKESWNDLTSITQQISSYNMASFYITFTFSLLHLLERGNTARDPNWHFIVVHIEIRDIRGVQCLLRVA